MIYKGLFVYIFKHGQNCSWNGISNRYDQALLITDDGPFEVDTSVHKIPVIKLKTRIIQGEKIFSAVVEHDPDFPMFKNFCGSEMMGGCFVYTSDSRFRELINFYGAVPLHDRYEVSKS